MSAKPGNSHIHSSEVIKLLGKHEISYYFTHYTLGGGFVVKHICVLIQPNGSQVLVAKTEATAQKMWLDFKDSNSSAEASGLSPIVVGLQE